MKKILLLTGLFLQLSLLVQSQELKSKMINGKFGFIDSKGTEVISPEYDDSREFSEGLAAVRLGNRWGYINAQNEIVIPFIYTIALDFIDGKAAVKDWGELGLKWGIINKDNKKIKNFEYDEVTRLPIDEKFYGELVLEKDGKKFYFDKYGYAIVEDKKIKQIETNLREKEVAQAGTEKETILGNMIIEKRVDESGTILTIGGQTVNIKFSYYKNLYQSSVYSFDIDGIKNIYFKSDNKAIKCNFSWPTYEKKFFITLPDIPWEGEKKPAPEILITIDGKWKIVNALNGQTIALPFELSYADEIIYNSKSFEITKFVSHANIDFFRNAVYCKTCNGTNYVQGKDYYETITTKTYTTTKEYQKRHTTGYDVTTRRIPVTKTEKILKKGKLELCKVCKGNSLIEKAKYLHWNGEKITSE